MPQADRPDIVLIVVDSLRADAVEPYGAAPASTPVLADLARRGGAAPRAYAAGSWTVPSHAALFSGLLPRAAGLIRAPDGTPESCAAPMAALRERLLPEVMWRAGYATGAVSTNLWVTPQGGFDVGFEDFHTEWQHRQGGIHGGKRAKLRLVLDSVRAAADDGAVAAGEVLGRWIARRRDDRSRPAFWFLNLIECHSPYMPPASHSPLGPLGRLRASLDSRRYQSLEGIWRTAVGAATVPDGALERLRAQYAGAVSYLDEWIGGLAARLDEAGMLADTLLIVTSDHGENLGENGVIGHAFSLDERLLRVPLVAAGPGAAVIARPGVPGPVSLAALPRLIAEATGAAHPWDPSELPEGVAVAEFDPPPLNPGAEAIVAGWGLEPEQEARLRERLTCAVDGRYKLVRREGPDGQGREELHDLEQDPLERAPQGPDGAPPARLAALRAGLEASDTGAAGAPGAPLTPEPALDEQARPEPTDEERRRIEEQMRRLGYL